MSASVRDAEEHPKSPLGRREARRNAAAAAAAAGRSSGAESLRAARLEAVAVTQQQQLLAVRARLSKTERRVLALSQRDDGKAVLLAEAEARSATQVRRRGS